MLAPITDDEPACERLIREEAVDQVPRVGRAFKQAAEPHQGRVWIRRLSHTPQRSEVSSAGSLDEARATAPTPLTRP